MNRQNSGNMATRKAKKILVTAAALLIAGLVIQVSFRYIAKPPRLMFAEWKDIPATVDAATRLADEVVQAKVTNIRRADDLVYNFPGEPNDQDRIPVEVVTLQIQKNHKGSARTIELFHIGGVLSPLSRPDPSESEAPPKPPRAVPKSRRPPSTSHASPYMLHDDPEYKVGEEYLLFVRKGPRVTIGGASVETHAIISPTTRFRISAGQNLESMTRYGFAPQFRGKQLRDLELRIPRQPVVPPR